MARVVTAQHLAILSLALDACALELEDQRFACETGDRCPLEDSAPIPDPAGLPTAEPQKPPRCATESRAVTWTRVGDWPNLARAGHSAVFDPERGAMILFGGEGADNTATMLALDGTVPQSMESTSAAFPSPRAHHTAILDEVALIPRMMIFGGESSAGISDETWELQLAGAQPWWPLAINNVLAVAGHSTIKYGAGTTRAALLFGGALPGDQLSAATWRRKLRGDQAWELFETTNVPPKRDRHSAVFDEVAGRMIVFGGRSEVEALGDVWALDLATATWSEPELGGPKPSARFEHSAIWDAPSRAMVIFGGSLGRGLERELTGETWLLSTEERCWIQLVPTGPAPSARRGHAAIFAAGKMYLFGGRDAEGKRGDLWELAL